MLCRYCAGTMPWGNPSEHNDFGPQKHDDGLIEVIGFTMTSLVSFTAFVLHESTNPSKCCCSFCRRPCRLEDTARGFTSVRRWSWPPLNPFLCRWMENPADWLHLSYTSLSGTRPTCCRRPREESLYHNCMSQYNPNHVSIYLSI